MLSGWSGVLVESEHCLFQVRLNLGQGLSVTDLGACLILNVDRVDRHALLGADAGVGDAKAQLADCHENVVEQPQSIHRLKFNDGVVRRGIVVDVNSLRYLCGHFVQASCVESSLGNLVAEVEVGRMECGGDGVFDTLSNPG